MLNTEISAMFLFVFRAIIVYLIWYHYTYLIKQQQIN